MTNRGGMFVDPVPASVTGTVPQGMAALDGRRAMGALLGTSFQKASGGAVSQSATTMALTIGQGTWVIPDPTDAAAVFLSPTDATILSPAAGPTTGSRRDLITVRQNNYTNGDPDSYAYVRLVPGTAAGSPSLPALPPGSQSIGEIDVPANAATAAACTVILTPGASTNIAPAAPAPINMSQTFTSNQNTPGSGSATWFSMGNVVVPAGVSQVFADIDIIAMATGTTAINVTIQPFLGSVGGSVGQFRIPGTTTNTSYSFGWSDSFVSPVAGTQALTFKVTYVAGSGSFQLNTGSLVTAKLAFH